MQPPVCVSAKRAEHLGKIKSSCVGFVRKTGAKKTKKAAVRSRDTFSMPPVEEESSLDSAACSDRSSDEDAVRVDSSSTIKIVICLWWHARVFRVRQLLAVHRRRHQTDMVSYHSRLGVLIITDG